MPCCLQYALNGNVANVAKRLLQVNTYEIEPSVELFEYLNVLNYVSSSDFASIDEFAEIWVKYMGPDIRVYYNEAYQNLKDLDLESQIQKVGGDLRKLNQIDEEQKISIRTMVEWRRWRPRDRKSVV